LIKTFLYRRLLPRLLSKACKSRIPRSGKKGEQVNCYVIELDQGDSPYFVATSIDGDDISGLKYDGNSYAEDTSISISDLKDGTLRITHYYGLSEVTYDSIYNVAFQYVTRFIYIKIRIYRYIDKTFQYFFNKRKLVSKRRMDLLRFMMDDQLDRTHKGIGSLDLLSKLFSMRLFLHPSFDVQHEKLELYLDSLVASGEIEKVNNEYVVTGKAISTLEKYEEEERRHTEAVKLQRKMFWIAIIALIFAVVQTGVIRLPTLMDLSNISIIEDTHKAFSADRK
jgi:hypothetical protein